MLTITIPGGEQWDPINQEFLYSKEQTLNLEHSLVSLSKWESKWHKPFITSKVDDRSREEIIDYIKCMTLNQHVDSSIYTLISKENMERINAYIDDSMSATWFNDKNTQKSNNEVITSELIYYWMIALNIPFECQKWHLNRLLTLIKICSIKNQPEKKMTTRDAMSRNAAINAANRKKFNTKG